MPDHVTNRVTVIKGDYDLSKIKDFNDIIPMPEDLQDTEHGSLAYDVEDAYSKGQIEAVKLKYLPSQDKLNEILKLVSNLDKYGHATWYGWSSEYWGTKWNMYDRNQQDNILTFDTAWAAPIKVYEALAKTLPEDVILKVEYASEDLGQHSGVCYLHQHDFSHEEFSQGSFEAYDLAVELKGMEDEVKYIEGEWVWLDEIDEDDCDE